MQETDYLSYQVPTMKSDILIHRFPDDCKGITIPDKFTYPFCYTPAEITKKAAGILMDTISSDKKLSDIFTEGKMLGVLVVRDSNGVLGFLAGFSGLAGGLNKISGFVPPVIDLADPQGHFKTEEGKISHINYLIKTISESSEAGNARIALDAATDEKICALSQMKEKMKLSKIRREEIRSHTDNPEILSELVKESQFEKASLKRLAAYHDSKILKAREAADIISFRIEALKQERARRSEALQKWIFENAFVENARGDRKNISDIFASKGLVPPGGTGECAAPKLLHYAYTHKLSPISMGEFWFSHENTAECPCVEKETRLHGRFYPSCTGKCGPLLEFMLAGLDVEQNPLLKKDLNFEDISIIYEDNDLIAVNKPSGVLSTPGKTGSKSVLEILEAGGKHVLSVHRLDMETSGVLVFAKKENICKALQKEFASRTVEKEYIALLETGLGLKAGTKGRISLPLCADYNDRPRQKADSQKGKEAITEYEIISADNDSARILFKPVTGRTHQLRVHSAHTSGLSIPIKGDRLYGSTQGIGTGRLFLHSSSVSFTHPVSGLKIKIAVSPDF